MKKLFILLFCLYASLSFAATYLPLTGAGSVAATAGYQGPGDVVSGAIAWWSCYRGYTASYAAGAGKSCNLVRASDSHTCDTLLTSSGFWNVTANCSNSGDNGTAIATWCNATTCSVTKAYDQSGATACAGSVACDVSQSTAADQPTISFSCINSLPCMVTLASSSQQLNTAGNVAATHAQPITFSWTAERTASFTSFQDVIGNSGNPQGGFANSASHALIDAGSVVSVAGYTDSAVHNTQEVFNSSTSVVYFDGTNSGSVNPSTLGISAAPLNLFNETGVNLMSGNTGEAGIWPSGFNATQAGNVCHNQFLVWSGAASC